MLQLQHINMLQQQHLDMLQLLKMHQGRSSLLCVDDDIFITLSLDYMVTSQQVMAKFISLTKKFLLLRYSLVFPIPATACTAVRESRPPKLRPLRSCTGRRAIRFLGSVSARLLATVRALLRRIGCFIDRSDYTMGDINNTHGGGGAAAGATFPVAMYVLFLSYLALLLVPCSDLMHVLSLMCVVKYACASVMLLSNKTLLWLTAMGVHRVAEGTPRGPLTPEEDKAFGDATVIFVGAVLSVLGDKLVDAYLHIRNGKELWDALDAKFGAADAGGELYAMEQFNDYRMVENRSVVEQAHEIQIMAKELELLKCVLPDKFVAGCIVAKLPPSWRNFATSLKHQRHEFSVENIMGSLDVEEKARAKDKHTGGTEGRSAANMVQKNAHKSKGKNKGVSQTTNFKKKGKTEKKDPCWVCGETGHWANRCPQRKGKKCQAGQNSTSVNMVIGNTEEGTTGFLVVKSGVDDMNVGTIFESRDATFFEDIFPMRDMHGMSSWESDPIHETPMESDEESDDESSDSDEDDNEAPTRSKRQRTAKSFGNDFIVYLVDDTPTTISEALASPDADYWKEAVQSEMDSILANGTWELTERPYGCKPVPPRLNKNLQASNRKATVEEFRSCTAPVKQIRFMHSGVGEQDTMRWTTDPAKRLRWGGRYRS
ncbi:hypothetical protein QYE76_031019 [Lolium multiflorum]|uniref:CCHC-type domain-containing protein n=1 Tax=Lolium multiflorum TaxID=4521 RepID=A0AAD8QSC4_LOLMU|nr:hypothetical protein QYE76_031019 [Lolium multiflorum]